MLGEVIRILAVADEQGREHYPTTLFDESEAQPGRCTARSTIYTRQHRRRSAGAPVRALVAGPSRWTVTPRSTCLAGELMVA